MKKLFQLIAVSLLISGMTLVPLGCSKTSLSSADKADASPEELFRFTLQHRFNDGEPLPSETIEISPSQFENNPLVFSEKLKGIFSKLLEKQKKPVQIDTTVDISLPTSLTQILGKLSTISMTTNIESDGNGKGHWELPAYKREISTSEIGLVNVDWKGGNGEFTFTNNFESITGIDKLLALTIKSEKGSLSLGETTFNGTLNADLMPTQFGVSLPSLEMRETDDKKLNLKAFSLDFNLVKTLKGLKLGNGHFKVGHFSLSDDGSKVNLEDLVLKASSEEQGEVINTLLETKIGKLILPKEITMEKDLKVNNYVGNIALRRLDAEAILQLQKTLQTLQGMSSDDPMLLMVLFGQFMAIAPKLIAQSPDIATKLAFKTPEGDLDGNFRVTLDGKKVTALKIPALLSALLAKAEFTIGKGLLEKVLTIQSYNAMLNMAKLETMYFGKELGKADLAQLKKDAKNESKQQIEMFVGQKFLVEDGKNNYKLDANFNNQKLTVNGQEISLPFLP
ncbi:DUF945 family protein [Candidatus Parabeggiatoa sp. HSG14]|uniref:DUF945 family protein n=1 Tax=Candidatus Parabeggiatoa sp. HSG14 TaxID=3055593 RepID=UPI0025A764DF|nr:DUF945 family protein [Thiotrichales bacterium HSG14]